MKPSTHYIQNKGASLHVTTFGVKDGETVFLLHGGPGVPNAMEQVASWLRKKYQVIYFEQRGTGRSVCKDQSYRMEDYISDIDAIADHLKLDKFHLFGHSWGGLYAEIYAEKRVDRIQSLFLCSPSSGTHDLWKETEKEVLQFNKKMTSNSEWLKMGWYSLRGNFGSDKAFRRLFEQVYKNYHKGIIDHRTDQDELKMIYAEPINQTRKEIIRYKPLDKMGDAPFRVTITFGEMDVYQSSLEKHRARFPKATFYELNASGHIPWLHTPKDFERVISQHFELMQ